MADSSSDPNIDSASEESHENFIIKYFKDFKILKETKKEYWGLQLINMLDCLAYFAMFNIIVVTLSRDFGFTDVGAGFVFAVFSSVTTIFLFISGVITDWLGIKRALYLAILGLLATRIGMVVVQYMDEPVRMNNETLVSVLDNGNGINFTEGQPDISITARNGTAFDVDFSGSQTIGDLLTCINEASGNNGLIEASIARGWTSLRLDDKSGGEGKIIVQSTEASPHVAGKLKLDSEGEESDVLSGKRIISDVNGVKLSEINNGLGLEGGSTLSITDRVGNSMTVSGIDQLTWVTELVDLLRIEAEAHNVNIGIDLNSPGNGLRISDKNTNDDGTALKEGDLIITGNAAEPLRILADESDKAGGNVSGNSLVENWLRNQLVWVLMIAMAPFMAMLITVFQAANRRFTTKRSRGAGFNLWYLFMNVGAAGGGFLIDIIYLRLGLPHFHVFTFGVVTGVLCVIAILLFIRNTDQLRTPEEIAEEEAKAEAEEGEESDGITELDPETGQPVNEKEGKKEKGMGPVAITMAVLSEPIFWRFTVLISLLLGVRAVFLYLSLLFPKFWLRVIGEDAKVGTMQAFNPVLVIIGLILVIPILQKFNVYKMLVFGALITSISMFIPAIPQMGGIDIVTWTYITTGVFLLILTVGELIWSPRLSEYTAAIAPEGQEGTYLGLSMVPYFLAKLVVSAFSGYMLMRWCPEYPPGEKNLGQRIEEGLVPFWDSPYVMWIILGTVAIVGTIIAILGKGWFTKGAHFDAAEKKE